MADIVTVHCAELRDGEETAFQPATSYSVRLLLKDGRTVKAAAWLDDQDLALFITQFIMQLASRR